LALSITPGEMIRLRVLAILLAAVAAPAATASPAAATIDTP